MAARLLAGALFALAVAASAAPRRIDCSQARRVVTDADKAPYGAVGCPVVRVFFLSVYACASVRLRVCVCVHV